MCHSGIRRCKATHCEQCKRCFIIRKWAYQMANRRVWPMPSQAHSQDASDGSDFALSNWRFQCVAAFRNLSTCSSSAALAVAAASACVVSSAMRESAASSSAAESLAADSLAAAGADVAAAAASCCSLSLPC